MPTKTEIAGWLREAANDIEQEIAPILGRVLSGPYTKKLRDRAAMVESMRCGTCKHYEGTDVANVSHCAKRAVYSKNKNFGCWEWEEK